MQNFVPFDPAEMRPKAYNVDGPFPNLQYKNPVFSSPISRKDNFKRLLNKEAPLWMPHFNEIKLFFPTCVPDHIARAHVSTVEPFPVEKMGGKDMFGVEWEFDAATNSTMVRPGNPIVRDLEHWEEYIQFPDVSSWDWEGCAKETRPLLEDGRIVSIALMSGFVERLISFVDVEEAMVALIDEDLQPAVHRLFDRLCSLYDDIFAHYETYFHADMVWFHDDWGTQRAPFFSNETAEEMLLPYIKRMVESAHRHNIIFNFHSCGQVEAFLPLMIKAGCDMWEGQNNNDKLKMAQMYGNDIIINVEPEAIPADASEEELRAFYSNYIEKYQGLRIYSGFRPTITEGEYALIYELSRKAYAGSPV